MKSILLFKKDQWKREEIDSFLKNIKIKVWLRYGFSHILAICNEDEINVDYLKNEKKLIYVQFDKKNSIIGKEAFLVYKNTIERKDTETLLKEESNLSFDLSKFGFWPTGIVPTEELFQTIRSSKPTGKIDVLQMPNIEEIIKNKNVSEDIKKILLDTYTLRATSIWLLVTPLEGTLTQYSKISLFAFVTRAGIEKTMLLLAKLDNALDFAALDNCKKMKKTFIGQSRKSKFALTEKMANFLKYVDLLDNNYRSPEVHKTGRLLGLIYKDEDNFETLINEVCSFQNDFKNIFQEVCKYLKDNYVQNT